MQPPNDSGIPTLTQRIEQPAKAPAVYQNNDVPILTKKASPKTQTTSAANTTAPVTPVHPAVVTSTAFPTSEPASIVLRAALQAEIENFLENAIEEATTHIRNRLDSELPAIIERALKQVRPG